MKITLKIFCIAPIEMGSSVGGKHAGSGYVEHIHSLFKLSGISHVLTENPDEASLILVLEPCIIHNYHYYASELIKHPIIQAYPERCYTYNGCDRPWPILPGMYVSLDKNASDPFLHCGGPHADFPNAQVQNTIISENKTVNTERRLACFRGSDTSAVRTELFRLASAGKFSDAMKISPAIGSYFVNGEEGQKIFVDEILSYAFSLAPAGNGPSSFRIYEIMSLGRTPVIVADSWLKPRNIPWAECSLEVSESDISNIEPILEKQFHSANELGHNAKSVYAANFAPEVVMKYIVESLSQLQEEIPYSDDPASLRKLINRAASQAPAPPLLNRVVRRLRNAKRQILSKFE